MKYLLFSLPIFLLANAPEQIKYNEKTEIDNGYIIYVDKEKSGDVSTLSRKYKKEKIIDMPTSYKKCISCHGEVGEKHAEGGVAFLGGQNKIRIMKKLAAYRNGTYSQGYNSKVMTKEAKELKDKEINDIALYLSQQKIPKEIVKKENNETEKMNTEFIY